MNITTPAPMRTAPTGRLPWSSPFTPQDRPITPRQRFADLRRAKSQNREDPTAARYGVHAVAISDLYAPRWADESPVIPDGNTSGLVANAWVGFAAPVARRRPRARLAFERWLPKLLGLMGVVLACVILYKLALVYMPGLTAWVHRLHQDPTNPVQTARSLQTTVGG